MRLHVLSDLHLEAVSSRGWTPPHVDADVVVLAGDITNSPFSTASWAWRQFGDRPVVLVLGNHEYFGSSISARLREVAELQDTSPVHLLENRAATIGGVRFFGCTLWSDFELFGPDAKARAIGTARRQLPDFTNIILDEPWAGMMAPRFTPLDAANIHEASRAWLNAALSEPFDGPTVVVTHHAPSWQSIALQWQDSLTSAAYASDLDWLIERHKPALWIHGHVHDAFDYQVGETRVLCNPKGFGMGHPTLAGGPGFRPDLVIEVGS